MPTGLLTRSQYTTNPPAQVSVDSELEVRGFYLRNFVAGDGVTVVQGNSTNGQQGPYYSIGVSLNGDGDLVVDAQEIQATTLSNPTSGYVEQLWVDGAYVATLLPNTTSSTGWQIPTVYGDPIAYDEIATYNRAQRLVYPPNTYFTADQTIEEIRRIAGDFDYAAVGVNGIGSTSVAPTVASLPILVENNDPRVNPNYPNLIILPYSGFSVGAQLRALKMSGGVATLTTPSDTGGCIAIGRSAGTNQVTAVVQGYASCAVDGSVAIGDYLQISSGNNGYLQSAGSTYPTSGQVIGRALTVDVDGLCDLDFFGTEVLGSNPSETINAQTGTSYAIQSSDRGKLITFSNASAIAATIAQAGTSFPSGWWVDLKVVGAGTVTLTPTTSTVDGAATLVMVQGLKVRLISNGTNYITGIGNTGSALTSLSNLASTAVNADIVPDNDATVVPSRSLGSYVKRFFKIYSAEARFGFRSEGATQQGINAEVAVQTANDWPFWVRVENLGAVNGECLTRFQHFSGIYVPQPIIAGLAANGTLASPTTLTNGNHILILSGRGFDGSAVNHGEYAVGWSDDASNIDQQAAGTWSGTSHPARIIFRTTASGSITPVEALRIAPNGNIGINFAGVDATSKVTIIADNGDGIYLQGQGIGPRINLDANDATSGSRTAEITYRNNSTAQWSTGIMGGDGKYHIYDEVNTTDRVLVLNTGNVKIAGSAVRGTTEGTNHLDIFNGTAPVGTLANGVSLYASGGKLFAMDAGGSATQLTP